MTVGGCEGVTTLFLIFSYCPQFLRHLYNPLQVGREAVGVEEVTICKQRASYYPVLLSKALEHVHNLRHGREQSC